MKRIFTPEQQLIKKHTLMKQQFNLHKGTILDSLGAKCIECGSTERLEVHHLSIVRGKDTHIKLKGRSKWKFYFDHPDYLKYLRILCHSCHWAIHGRKVKVTAM